MLALLLALACHKAPPTPAAATSTPTEAPAPAEATTASSPGAPADIAPVGGPWEAPLGQDHPWTGHILRVSDGAWIDEATLVAALHDADLVLLGEKHDNPDHHRLQARVVAALAGPEHAVGFEQLDHAVAVDDADSPTALAELAAWADSGWPDFALYEPVFAEAFDAGARIVAAHPTRDEVRAVMSDGLHALDPDLTDGLPDRPLSDAARADLEDEIVTSHCGMADDALVEAMVRGQTFKDAFMARALVEAGAPAILVAGNGHVRPDRGVPHYLDLDAVAVSFLEVPVTEGDDPAGDAFELPDLAGEADFAWFTPRVDDADPCERFREQLEKMKGHGPEGHGPEEDG